VAIFLIPWSIPATPSPTESFVLGLIFDAGRQFEHHHSRPTRANVLTFVTSDVNVIASVTGFPFETTYAVQ